jgi:hypothetical protein
MSGTADFKDRGAGKAPWFLLGVRRLGEELADALPCSCYHVHAEFPS